MGETNELRIFYFCFVLQHKNPWVIFSCQKSLAGSNVLSYNYFWSVKDCNMFQSTITRVSVIYHFICGLNSVCTIFNHLHSLKSSNTKLVGLLDHLNIFWSYRGRTLFILITTTNLFHADLFVLTAGKRMTKAMVLYNLP